MKHLIKFILPNNLVNHYKTFRDRKQKKKNEKIFSGNNVHCPVCRSSYRLFGPYGVGKRENAMCHNCNSLERHRLIYMYLKDKLNFFDDTNKKRRILHFAPEKMFYNIFSNNSSIDYNPCDLYPEVYQLNGNTKVLKVDITKIPYENESFDFVLCNHVLEHVPDDNLAMEELFRVMNQNGDGLFQVPIDYSKEKTYEDWSITTPKGRLLAFGQEDHVRIYGQDYINKLQKVGFIVKEIDYASSFSSNDIFKFGLMKSEKIYHVRKQ